MLSVLLHSSLDLSHVPSSPLLSVIMCIPSIGNFKPKGILLRRVFKMLEVYRPAKFFLFSTEGIK